MRHTIVYVHGNGNKPRADRLRLEWDRALFGRDVGRASRMAYWAPVRYSRPLDELPEMAAAELPHLVESPEQFIADTLLEAVKEGGTVQAEASHRREPLEPWLARMTYAAEALAGNGDSLEALPLPRAARIAAFRALVKRSFQDVHAYFFGGDGDAMRAVVRKALTGIDGPVVVLAHSLGSIIAYDVLREFDDRDLAVPLLVTVGSPLGVTEVQDLVTNPLEVPAVVGRWLNVSDLRDLVALDHTIRSEFRPVERCHDAFVTNSSDNHHGIVEYLRSRPVRDAVLSLFGNGPEAAVAARVADRTAPRRTTIRRLRQPGGLAKGDDPRRVAARIDRLGQHHPDLPTVDAAALAAGEPAAVEAAENVLERIILTDDLLGVGYLEGGVAASRAVARVVLRDERDRVVGFGTGSMVSPELLLTNHHVLGDPAVAARARVEFDYQDGFDGAPLPVTDFGLDPDRFFLADKALDFALVAVAATPAELRRFGHNTLIGAEGKAIAGDYVTIIQHPGGEKKQIALRENRIVDVLDQFLHYETDTEPGSSGSPVFNDQWEVVALHHAAVPAPEHDELGAWVNEGLRVSRLLAFLRGQEYPSAQHALVAALLGEDGTVETEAVRIDPDYTNRTGYDPDFLTGHHVPLPALPRELVELASVNQLAAAGDEPYVLPYHHFSAVLNKERGLAFFTAVNIDGATGERLPRERDRWSLDPRVPAAEQTGEAVYRDNPLDRGHLVRRLDPAWGETRTIAKSANDDTFHFTNCAPQHEDFNQNETTWAGLEDYILNNADNRDLRVSVYTGPVFAPDDDQYRGVRLPRQFWKVVVMVTASGELSATGYLLSQATLIEGLEVAEEFSYGAYRTFQVPVSRVEALTRLSFGELRDVDPLGQLEAIGTVREIAQLRQITL
jgi:endonuclease G, mitochondrial